MEEKDEELSSLGVEFISQDKLENSITKKANKALLLKDSEIDQKRLDKTKNQLQKAENKLRVIDKRINDPRTKISQRTSLKDDYDWCMNNEIIPLRRDIDEINTRLEHNKDMLENPSRQPAISDSATERLPDESEKEYLIRIGKITAFGNKNVFLESEDKKEQKSHIFLRQPGFKNQSSDISAEHDERNAISNGETISLAISSNEQESSASEFGSEEDYAPEDFESNLEDDILDMDEASDNAMIDDADESHYQQRLKKWVRDRRQARKEYQGSDNDPEEEWYKSHPSIQDAIIDSRFKLPGDIYPSLFDYQKTCVQWLWELYSQKTGGIIGDEMGLGKTIQVITFLAGLHYSKLLDKPAIIVVPTTIMGQWVKEFHKWWPPLRCVILHSIGSGMSKALMNDEEKYEAILEETEPGNFNGTITKNMTSQFKAKKIVDSLLEKGGILITTYVSLRIYSKHIIPHEWGYVVLDEGHKIRNPDSDITLTCKQLKTSNRIILSGTPIQNNLKELWSLFDFVFPGRLGTLPVFQQQFVIPINMGGYANASNVQVQTGYKCAVVLRDLISPYLLRRLKVDVAQDLPKKTEMVLFVKLTKFQQDLYEMFLSSEQLESILKGRRNMLMGVDILRKICNHPDLINRDALMRKKKYEYGDPKKSGKMQVLSNLLVLWKSQKHRTLLFCQTRQMLDILENFVRNLKLIHDTPGQGDFKYLRMDGTTPISQRQFLVDAFNNNTSYDVFLLTTKVGGLGINLTGADRVIIYDPDWNPSTDIQARERAWRLGQKKDITIYRLMVSGTIEEKIYHRQIFKTFLTNKILKDPKQRRFFKVNDLHDLFSLGDPDEKGTETGDLFNGVETKFNGKKDRQTRSLVHRKRKNDDDFSEVAKLSGVSKLNRFEDGEEPQNEENLDENRLMEGIFAKSGVVHSALKHDDIINSSEKDVSIIEREANRVAAEAVTALKRSRLATKKSSVGMPTWTGRFGVAGKFGPKSTTRKREDKNTELLSSSSILGSLKKKAGIFESATEATSTLEGGREEKVAALVDFLKSRSNHTANSKHIIEHMGLRVNTEKEMIFARSILREIATWNRDSKTWTLKADFV